MAQLTDIMDELGTATASELTSDNKLLLKVGNTMKSLPGDAVAKEESLNKYGLVFTDDVAIDGSSSSSYKQFYAQREFIAGDTYIITIEDNTSACDIKIDLRTEKNLNSSSFVYTTGDIATGTESAQFVVTMEKDASYICVRSSSSTTLAVNASVSVANYSQLLRTGVMADISSIYSSVSSDTYSLTASTDYAAKTSIKGIKAKSGDKVNVKFEIADGAIRVVQFWAGGVYQQAIRTFNEFVEVTLKNDADTYGFYVGDSYISSDTDLKMYVKSGILYDYEELKTDEAGTKSVAEYVQDKVDGMYSSAESETISLTASTEVTNDAVITGISIPSGTKILFKFDLSVDSISALQFRVNGTYKKSYRTFGEWDELTLDEDATYFGIYVSDTRISADTDLKLYVKYGIVNELDERLIPLEYEGNYGLNSYYDDTWKSEKIAEIKGKTEICDLSFVFATDFHFNNNSLQSKGLIKWILDNSTIPFALFGGDYPGAYGTESDCRATADILNEYVNYIGKERVFGVRGNHDFTIKRYQSSTSHEANTGFTSTAKFAYNSLTKPSEFRIDSIQGGKFYYYIDIPASKTRIFMLCSCDSQGTDTTASWDVLYSVSKEQIAWLVEKVTEKEGWNFVFVSHIPADPSMESYSATQDQIHAIAKAIKNKTAYSYSGITADFTSSESKFICHLCGHNHADLSNVDDNVLSISTTSDAHYDDDGYGRESKVGTTEEQAIDVFSIDYDNSKIYATRIGGGSSREWTF